MINIALINHVSVIYCHFFSHLAPTRKLWRISRWSFVLSSQRRFWVFGGSFSGILVLHSSHIIRVGAPRWFFAGLCRVLYKQLLQWKNGGEHKGNHVCTRGLNVLSDRQVHDALFRAWRIFFHSGPNSASVFFFLNRNAVFLKERYGFL